MEVTSRFFRTRVIRIAAGRMLVADQHAFGRIGADRGGRSAVLATVSTANRDYARVAM